MQNDFTKYLSDHDWEQISPMTFKNKNYVDYEIFFDTSNQIELYYENERRDEKYLLDIEDLKYFLIINGLAPIS